MMDHVDDTMSSLDEFFHYTQSPPPGSTTLPEPADWQQWKPNRSTSSSSSDSSAFAWTTSVATDSTASTSPSSAPRTEMQFTWLPANASSVPTARKQFNSKVSTRKQRVSTESPTTPSSPPETVDDAHAEESCAKCRLTEVEARKLKVERRREQNRASQRKFRARKEAKIRDAASQVSTLETYIDFLETHNNDLEQTNAKLTSKIAQLEDQTGLPSLVSPKAETYQFRDKGTKFSSLESF